MVLSPHLNGADIDPCENDLVVSLDSDGEEWHDYSNDSKIEGDDRWRWTVAFRNIVIRNAVFHGLVFLTSTPEEFDVNDTSVLIRY